MTSVAVATLVKVSALLAAALAVDRLLRPMSARLRHLIWTTWFGALLALPLLIATLPPVALVLPVLATTPAAAQPSAETQPTFQSAPLLPARPEAVGPSRSTEVRRAVRWYAPLRPGGQITVSMVLLSLWGLGAVLAAAMMAMAAWRVRALARASSELRNGAWLDAASAISVRAGLKQVPRLRVHHSVEAPMAGGWFRPTIFLPPSAERWRREWRDVVLAHEIAHLAAHDSVRHLLVRLTLATYWCHPLAWVAARAAGAAREQACDEAVVSLGTRPSAYARALMELSHVLRSPAPLPGALAIVGRGRLETRLLRIVSIRRGPFSRATFGTLLVLLLSATTGLAVIRPVAATPAALPDVALPLSGVDVAPQASVAPRASFDARDAMDEAWSAAQTPSGRPPGDGPTGRSQESGCESRWQGDGPATYSFISGPNTRRGYSIRWKSDAPWISVYDGDLRACMAAELSGPRGAPVPPSGLIEQASHFMMESSLGASRQSLEVTRRPDGEAASTWRVDGVESPLDDPARRWQEQMLVVFDAAWEAGILRDQDDLLSSQIKSLETQRSNIRAEVASLESRLASVEGEVSLRQERQSMLRAQVGNIRRHERSLKDALDASREMERTLGFHLRFATGDEREELAVLVAAHAEDTARLERALVEHAADARVAALDRELAALDTPAAIAAIRGDVDGSQVQQRIAELERELATLDVDQRVRDLNGRRRELNLRNRMAVAASLRDRNFQWLRSFIEQVR